MAQDITVPVADGFVNVRVGAIIIKDERVLMVRNSEAEYYYSVGGRIQFGESAEEDDVIRVDGKELPSAAKSLYILLNKPRGYVTTLHDEKGRRDVTQLLRGVEARVYPVGRLDMDSEGLLLLTNDGAFANRLMHPSHEVEKCYETWVEGADLDTALNVLRGPLELDGYRLHAAEVELAERLPGGARLYITIHEGRNRQVRRMCELAGLRVTRLRRIQEVRRLED